MKAVELVGYGDVTKLHLVDRPIPEARSGQVLIKVEAAGVVFADTLLRRDGYFLRPSFPYRPGREAAGEIVAVGPDVEGYELGDRVYTFMAGGGYAEYVAADVAGGETPIGTPMGQRMFPIGRGVSGAQAISHGINLRVAHLALHGRSSARPGQVALIHAASGGVGAHLTRLAAALGLEVIALAGSEEKMAYCLENGAAHVINYRERDYVEDVGTITAGKGVHISFNSVSGDTFMRDTEILRWGGELVMTGRTRGAGNLDPTVALKGLTYKWFASYTHFGEPEDVRACEYVGEQLQAPSHQDRIVTLPLDEVRHAHQILEDGTSFGKIVLQPSPTVE